MESQQNAAQQNGGAVFFMRQKSNNTLTTSTSSADVYSRIYNCTGCVSVTMMSEKNRYVKEEVLE